MHAEPGQKPMASLFVRLIARPRPLWLTMVISLLLLLSPLAAAYLDGLLVQLFREGQWRPALSAAAVIAYILAVSPTVARAEAGVISAFRPLVVLDDDAFEQLVARASRIKLWHEGLALGLGALAGLAAGWSWITEPGLLWHRLVIIPLSVLMFSLLAWTIYIAVAGTRLMAALHAQPLRFDIFDTTPFRPVGRQSLVIALVFVGGIVLGMIFGLQAGNIRDWRNWLMYALLGLVPVIVFFLNMRPTHRVLAAEKARQLAAVQGKILGACRLMMARLEEGEGTDTLPAEINALTAFEKRLQATSTWPYDTGMLRALFFSVVFPGIAALARLAGDLLFD